MINGSYLLAILINCVSIIIIIINMTVKTLLSSANIMQVVTCNWLKIVRPKWSNSVKSNQINH